MQQKFVFKRNAPYHARLVMKHNTEADEWWPSTLSVNLTSMNNQVNIDYNNTPIKDEQDAINRVTYNITHEFLHLAQYNCEFRSGIQQERHIYAMIGNGGNSYFNTFYKIEKNPMIESLTA